MGKALAPSAIEQYERDGYYFPVRVLSEADARESRDRVERVEHDLGGPLRGIYRIKPHLLLTWLADLVRHPAILDAVEDVIGPDILCWNASFFEPRPEVDFDPAMRVLHAEISDRQAKILYRGTTRTTF